MRLTYKCDPTSMYKFIGIGPKCEMTLQLSSEDIIIIFDISLLDTFSSSVMARHKRLNFNVGVPPYD